MSEDKTPPTYAELVECLRKLAASADSVVGHDWESDPSFRDDVAAAETLLSKITTKEPT